MLSHLRLGAFLVAAVLAAQTSHAGFQNATASAGIDYLHASKSEVPTNQQLGLDRDNLTPVSNHAGAAAVDIDGDGWTDFLGARWSLAPVLYRNNGDGTFAEEGVARGMGSAVDAASFGCADFDNDGDADIIAAPHLGQRFFYLLNDGSGHFTEVAEARGVALTVSGQKHEGYSVGIVDFDLDGYLDVYISEWGPLASAEDALHSVLLRNLGAANPGHFENVTAAAGVKQPQNGIDRHHGFSTAWADFDDDGWPDFAKIADFNSGQFFWNNGNGTFSEGSLAAGVSKDEFGMGVAVADYDGDGRLDYYATSIHSQFFIDNYGTNTGNKLYRNLGDRNFSEVAKASGVSNAGWSWGAAFFDFENDGDQDLVVTNGDDIGEMLPAGHAHQAALTDPTTLYQNGGNGTFVNITSVSGISDTKQGKAIVVLDYDKDGDEDLLITNTFDRPILYRNDASENGRKWIRFAFQGDTSNRDGFGAQVRLTAAGKTQTGLFNPSNAFIGQREPYLHFGLGQLQGSIEVVTVRWPSGIEQTIESVEPNQTMLLVEPAVESVPPIILEQPEPVDLGLGGKLELSVKLLSAFGAAYSWERDGVPIPGANGPVYEVKRAQPFDAGVYRARVTNAHGVSLSEPVTVTYALQLSEHSIARWWIEFLLEAIRKDFPAPTIHSRNLYHTSAALWDAFWAYEPDGWQRARPVFQQETLSEVDWGPNRAASQREAMSFAAYRMLEARYRNSVGRDRTLYNLRWLMEQLGYDADDEGVDGNAPSAVGNRIAASMLAVCLSDGSNEANGYVDTSNYQAANEPLVFKLSGAQPSDPNRWQPLAFDYQVTQNGIPIADKVQSFVGVNWRAVSGFALRKDSATTIAWDPGPPPLFGSAAHAEYVAAAVELIRYSSLLDPARGELIDISPGGLLNNPLGTNAGTGHAINPATGQPYAANVVNHADYGRVLAEFWADGPSSETPPGHWNSVLNDVSEHPRFERRYLGIGAELSQLEWDVQSYLALNGAMHDAAIAAWTLKRQYDYARPITMVRCLGELGQSSDPQLPSYNAQGLPLIDGLIELVTAESSAPGQRHEALGEAVGKVAIRAWAGEPADPDSAFGGSRWMLAADWRPYQRSTFVTPAFAAYVSGHSTFSRAGAEVLTLLTGSPFFPGGIGEYHFPAGVSLEFEKGPTEDVTLQWATYYDAADQAGLSRLYGGIHVPADDFVGRRLGARIGTEAFLKANALRSSDSAGAFSAVSAAFPHAIAQDPLLLRLDYGASAPPEVRFVRANIDGAASESDATHIILDTSLDMASISTSGIGLRSALVIGRIVDPAVGIEVRFELPGTEARLYDLRAMAGDWLASPMEARLIEAQLALTVYSIDDEGRETEIASNAGVAQGDQSSLIQVLALRGGFSEAEATEIDAGLILPLAPGRYRIHLASLEPLGPVTLQIEQAMAEL